MKSTTATAPLLAAQTQLADRHSELTDLTSRLGETSARLTELENTCDLNDAKALAEIARLQTLTALLPRRINNVETAIPQVEEALLSACHAFISEHLGPRARDIVKRAKVKVEAGLKPMFDNPNALEAAVNKSTVVTTAELILSRSSIVSNPGNGVTGYANRLLSNWEECDAVEAKIS